MLESESVGDEIAKRVCVHSCIGAVWAHDYLEVKNTIAKLFI
jgi:hypothetical protein